MEGQGREKQTEGDGQRQMEGHRKRKEAGETAPAAFRGEQ